VIGLIRQGTVRAIAFTGKKPFPEFPDAPLMKELLPGYEGSPSWGMFFAPGKTPAAIVDKLNAAVRAAVQEPVLAKVLQRDGYFPDNRNAEETAAFFRKEVEGAAIRVKAAGIEAN
jgi:tripartite-type tricarboxylate transporter receptor subunit TctC